MYDIADVSKVYLGAFSGFAIEDFFWRASLCLDDVAVNSRETNCFNSSLPQCCKNVCIYLSGKNHLRHFQRCVIGYTTAFNDRLFDAEFFREVTKLFAAAVNNADADSYLMKESQLFRERSEVVVILRHFTGQLDDKRVTLKTLNVRERFAEQVESELVIDSGCCLGHKSLFVVSSQ